MQRRNFLGALFCAPAIVKAENLMRLDTSLISAGGRLVQTSYSAGMAKSMDLTRASFERALKELMEEEKPIRMGFKIDKEGDLWVARAVPVSL